VKQLQNSLAHQRLSQSRTSLDDSEYTARFSRLDGLVAQLAFSIRKSWKTLPSWLASSVNRDAVATGKQEMTAAGRAVLSSWIVEEIFDKYFHPDLEPSFSIQLKTIQTNIRRSAPMAQTVEEDDSVTSKIINWRLATLEGLQEVLKSPQCAANRQLLIDYLKGSLVAAVSVHLQDPPPSDLDGGVHMIVELAVGIAAHVPLESREVAIEYFVPGWAIVPEQMKLETGCPALVTSIADDAAERASFQSAASDVADGADGATSTEPAKKRSMLSALSALNGASERKPKPSAAVQGRQSQANSPNSQSRPGSPHGGKDDAAPPRVRMAAGFGVQVRGKSILVKAPVFST